MEKKAGKMLGSFYVIFFLTKRTRIKKLKVKHANEECLAKRIHYSVTKKNILLAATTGFSQLEFCDTNLEKRLIQ